jgi:Zn-dependent protease/predicted transcriptional regulator
MESHIKLGRIFGVKIGLHYTWIIIALLIVFSLVSRFHEMRPEWATGVVWATAIITGALFFAAIIAHELSHALIAKLRGLPVHSITLFALGGMAQIEADAADAKTELWVSIAGPVASALLGFICLGLALSLGWTMLTEPGTPLMAMLVWLGYINIMLAIYNMIPGFPMDGGRALRAVIWRITGDRARATCIATLMGQFIAFGFIVLGLHSFLQGVGFGGLWFILIGWFLLQAARSAYRRLVMNERLRGVRVSDVMARDCPVVDGRSNLQTLVFEYLLRTGGHCFVIVENGAVAGLITRDEVRAIDEARWPFTTVNDVIVPVDRLQTVRPETPVTEALDMIERAGVRQALVMSDDRLEGILLRDQLLRSLATRAEPDK